MKKILGLDLGTNSIGWALISTDENEKHEKIDGAGSRIIPMDAAILGDFDKGNSTSQTKERTVFRGVRRLKERVLLRRERLHRVLNILEFLPEHYVTQIDFERHFGKFKNNAEPKIAWNDSKPREFLFIDSFDEMVADFKQNQPTLFEQKPNGKIPYDWTLYFLRKKALTQKISKEELAWILLNFNQKRGYYQLRGEEEASENKTSKIRKYFTTQKIISITDTEQLYKGLKILLVELEDGSIGKLFKREIPEWIGRETSIFVTVDIDKDGKDRVDDNGIISQRFSIPTEAEWETEWSLIKLKTEEDLSRSGKTVGQYIYDTLLKKPNQKIRGKLVRVIERKYYKDELKQIIATQTEFHPELRSAELYDACINELYRSNEAYRNSISNRDFEYLLVDDILFYQRPLKSKKSLISNCKYESNFYVKDGVTQEVPLKVIPKSHPLYQEFRLWKFVSQLKLFKEDKDITGELLKCEDDYVALYEWLNTKKEIQSKELFKWEYFGITKKEQGLYRWNYVIDGDKKYPCNETLSKINHRLTKQELAPISDDLLPQLWHILYSVTDTQQIKSALARFARKNGYEADKFVTALKGCVFESDYGAYSEKAVKKILSLMRRGKYWNEQEIDKNTKDRIVKIIGGEFDEKIDERTRKIIDEKLTVRYISVFCGLDEVVASYLIYGRHSESKDCTKWSTPEDMDRYLREFRQHSMNNPIVEQVVMETLRTVRDIWKRYGTIDEIHIELGREMKKTKLQREQDSKRINENENTNIRIKRLLAEFQNESYQIDNVRPHSPSQQDILKIYEEIVISNWSELPDDIKVIRKKFNETDNSKQPKSSEVLRYKLWLDQQYRSPYTGAIIPLGRLFTHEYEIEHVIPQSRFFDNSFSNKVICEAEVNSLKGNKLGLEFIRNHHGEKVTLSNGRVIDVFDEQSYIEHVKKYYSGNKAKMNILLLDEIPDKFIARQLNDTRYISRFMSGLLSNIVREADEIEANSKHLIMCNGSITTALKQDWGLNDVWNRIVSPRFERLNEKTESTMFGKYVVDGGKRYFQTQMPLELAKGFNKKRIDHRHHAMDAIVIACATRSHINYLNNQSAKDEKGRYDLRHKLCFKDKSDQNGNYSWRFLKPWDCFTQDVHCALEDITVSFKQNLRVINKASNRYSKIDDKGKRVIIKQEGENWAIRKSMHKDTIYGQVNLRDKKRVRISEALENHTMIVDKVLKGEIKKLLSQGLSSKIILKNFRDKQITYTDIYYFSNDTADLIGATRKSIDSTFDAKKIEAITDSGIRKILLAHLADYENNPEVAFSAEGLEAMNKNIAVLNGGKGHKPIYKARFAEPIGNKFQVGQVGSKAKKYVEADKGTNLFFAIYIDENGKRNYESIPLNIAIDRQKQGLGSAPERSEKGDNLIFTLSPNDLVYVPTADQLDCRITIDDIDKSRIYKMVSCTKKECHFIPHRISSRIIDNIELGTNNKSEKTWGGELIKSICIPIKVDRLGTISIKQ